MESCPHIIVVRTLQGLVWHEAMEFPHRELLPPELCFWILGLGLWRLEQEEAQVMRTQLLRISQDVLFSFPWVSPSFFAFFFFWHFTQASFRVDCKLLEVVSKDLVFLTPKCSSHTLEKVLRKCLQNQPKRQSKRLLAFFFFFLVLPSEV